MAFRPVPFAWSPFAWSATMNAAKLTPDALQALMQHKDYQTTQRYINMARQLNPAVADLYVPAIPLAVAN